MPLQLRRRNGSVTPFRNSEYIPFYYFIPKSILKKCGADLAEGYIQGTDRSGKGGCAQMATS